MTETDIKTEPQAPTEDDLIQKASSPTLEEIFDAAIERYRNGEGPDTLLPVFKNICEASPKNSVALTCLSWLYLLADKPDRAYKAAKQAVKLNPQDAQARVNLAIAMLEVGQKGVREHIEVAARLTMALDEIRSEIQRNFEDGLSRRPGWQSMQKVQNWLLG